MEYIVVCRSDKIGRRRGPFVLCTRRVFADKVTAEIYAKTVAPSRQPLVIEGRFSQLRFGNVSDVAAPSQFRLSSIQPLEGVK